MTNILFVETSPRAGKSISSKYAQQLLQIMDSKLGSSNITSIDLNSLSPDFVDQHWLEWNYGDRDNMTEEGKTKMQENEIYSDQILNTDYIVISTPIYNFSVPALLKAWMDHLSIPRKTFKFQDGKQFGLVSNIKKVIVVSSSGQDLKSMATEGKDYFSGLLKTFFGSLGVRDVEILGFSDRNLVLNEKLEKDLDKVI
jgi:FMN-dependent NADH-azoreductase